MLNNFDGESFGELLLEGIDQNREIRRGLPLPVFNLCFSVTTILDGLITIHCLFIYLFGENLSIFF
jgi:hypothetical protein